MLNEVLKLLNNDFTNVNFKPPFRCYAKANAENFDRLLEISLKSDLTKELFNKYLKDGYNYLFLDKDGVLWMNNLFTDSFSGIAGGYGCYNEVIFEDNKWKIV